MATQILMPALSPDHDRGQAGALAEKCRRRRARRRRDRGDRDRQGDDGGRGGRRGQAGPDPGRRGHRRRGGEHADRGAVDEWRGRRRWRRTAGAGACAGGAARGSGAAAAPAHGAGRGAPAAVAAAPEKDWGPTAPITVREALRDAMAAEMRADERRVPDRRGSRAISGRLQNQPGPAGRIRRHAGSSTRRSPNTASPAWRSARR